MANTKISALTALTGASVAADDVIPIVDTSATATKKIRADEFGKYYVLKGTTTRIGGDDAAAPSAQTIDVPGVVAGTANTAGANLTIKGSASTGSANGGQILFQVTPAGGAGSSQNAYSTALTIYGDRGAIFSNYLAVSGQIQCSSAFLIIAGGGSIGYYHGAASVGGTVTQATSKSTGVTLNKPCGEITMNAAALASATTVSFVLTSSSIAANDVLILNHSSGGTAGSYTLNARCAAGSATIDVRNVSAGSLSEAIVIRYALIKAATN